MKFIIEPINDTDCRIVDVDCSDMLGQKVEEIVIPSSVEHDGKRWTVKEVGTPDTFTAKQLDNGEQHRTWSLHNGLLHATKTGDATKYATLQKLKKIIISEGIEAVHVVMGNRGSNADERGNADFVEEVVLPSTLRIIGHHAFDNCRKLSAINIPDSVEEIGVKAFERCKSLPLFQWPKSLRRVDLSAFDEMKEPETPFDLVIPAGMEEITLDGYQIRYGNVTVPATAWEVFDASPMTDHIAGLDIPEGAKKVTGEYSELKHLSLPSTLEEIGPIAFARSKVLEDITELPASLRVIGEAAFRNTGRSPELKEIRIKSDEITIGKNAFADNRNVRLLADEAVMRSIMGQPGALNGTLVEAIDIPEGATEVNVCDCPELTRLTIPSTVTTITSIEKCPKLTELVIPDSVTTLGSIGNLPLLKELQLPASIKHIEGSSNNGVLYGLKCEIKIASPDLWRLLSVTKYAIKNYGYDGEVTIPEGIETLGEDFISGTFPSISLPSTLKLIGEKALSFCKGLKTITIPAAVEEIGLRAFDECKQLETVVFAPGSQLKKVGLRAFNNTAIKHIEFPEGMTTISAIIFEDCETLESMTFPASMTTYQIATSGWSRTVTSGTVVRCKNLKHVVFLADDPATAVYPKMLGKKVDWYVPDPMVAHVKTLLAEKKVDAKAIKPLSKLTGGEAKKAPAPKKQQALTQAIRMETSWMKLKFEFAVPESDMPMLQTELGCSILAARYLRRQPEEWIFELEGPQFGAPELTLETAVNSATEKIWHATPKSYVDIDFADAKTLPEDFPAEKAAQLAQYGSFEKLFASRHPNYDRGFAKKPAATLKVSVFFSVVFDFMVGEKEKFNVKKITVMNDWRNYWHFAFMYDGRYIPATSVVGTGINGSYKFWEVEASPAPTKSATEGFSLSALSYMADELPLMKEILSLVNK